MADKTASELAAEEREKIAVENNKREEEKEEKEENREELDTEKEENENEETDEKEENESEETEEKEQELTAEQKQIRKLERTIERLQKRVGKTTSEKNEIAKQLQAAVAALSKKKEEGELVLDEDEVEKRAEEKAQQKAIEAEFDRAQKRLINGAIKIDKNFMTKVNIMAEEVAPMPLYMITILDEIDNGAAVLNYLSDNIEEYEDIHLLSPAKMSLKLAKLSAKIEEETKPKPKKLSKVPPPNEPIGGNTKSPNTYYKDMPMDEYVKMRNQQTEERRKAKMR